MNSVQCPQCGWVNPASALECPQCHSVLSPPPGSRLDPSDNKTGRLTFLFYRIYCVFMIFLNLCLAGAGFFMIISSAPGYPGGATAGNPRATLVGWLFIIVGIVFCVPFLGGIFLPRKPWTWILGIVLMAYGMTSICFLPFVGALIFFWVKPETQAYFGRKIPS